MKIMKDRPSLSASEKSFLWINYMVDSMAVCCLTHFVEVCEDKDIKEQLKFALDLSLQHVNIIEDIFKAEDHPVPNGFNDNDVNLKAPRLFSDEFVLLYLHQIGNMGLTFYAKALAVVTREDIHNYFSKCIKSSLELDTSTKRCLLDKGLYVRPPYIPNNNQVEMVKKEKFMNGFLGKQRPLNAIEISNLFFNMQTIEIVRTLVIGFAQVAKDKEVRDLMTRAKEISNKTAEIFRKDLANNDLSYATPWNTLVTDSKEPPFSDKLMMFHGAVLNGGGVEQYGFSLATSLRRDLGARYMQLLTEMLTYSDDGMNLMIKNQWMEQPPMPPKRV